jgi:uncharacterized protein involved in exopolysaccharide biosynthesis
MENRSLATQTAIKPQREIAPQPDAEEISLADAVFEDSRARQAERLRLLWDHRRFVLKATTAGLIVSIIIAFLIPKSYTATTQLMPPDPRSTSSMAMMAAMAAKSGGDLGSVAGDLLGLKSSGALFIGVLRSQTSQDHLIQQFDLRRVYGKRLVTDARTGLDENTVISEDKKSGILTIRVTDHSPQRAAALAGAYVDQLNSLVSELSTSSAHRERVFLEERLKIAQEDLDDASNQLAQFSSKNNTLDIQTEGKAMLDAAGVIAGQMIAAQSELEGLRQIYTDNNPRVRALDARVSELRKQLEKLGGTTAGAAATGESTPAASDGMPYPTIRSLPLLGAKYSDYYRRAKVQETVFELLTEQYELAKMEEAKETPSVKVLDPAEVPERKSFPPRMPIMLLGTILAFSTSAVWVLGVDLWRAADPEDPRKLLAQEVVAAVKKHAQWFSRNGARPGPGVNEQADLKRLERLPSPNSESGKSQNWL